MSELAVKGLTTLHLVVLRCKRCGQISPQGFPHQLCFRRVPGKRQATAKLTCKHCSTEVVRTFRLTTSDRATRRRLLDWMSLFWYYLHVARFLRLPLRWAQKLAWLTLWLEHKVPL